MSNGKVALVTGASRGIGNGIATELAKQGYDIAFTYHESAELAKEFCEKIEQMGVTCRCYQASLEDITVAEKLVDRVHEDFGRIDALVCNAARDRRMSIILAEPVSMTEICTQLYMSQMLLAGAAARHMIKDKIEGSILFITSVHGQMAVTNDFIYGGMKAAVERSCESLALELSPYRINVNCIAPGAIDVRHPDNPAIYDMYAKLVPMGWWGRVEDIAKPAAFLLSEGAKYITGVTLRVDGGFAIPGQPEGWAEGHPVHMAFVENAYKKMMENEMKKEEEKKNV